MKKRLSYIGLIVYLISITHTGYSQTPLYNVCGYMGLKLGSTVANIVTFSSNPLSKGYSPANGFTGAYFIELPITRWAFFQPGIDFQLQGANRNGLQAIANPTSLITGDYAYANFNDHIKLDYLQIPLQAKFIWNAGKKLKGYATIGPDVSFLIGARSISSGTSDVYSDEEGHHSVLRAQSFNSNQSVMGQMNKFNIGATGSLGLSLNTKKGRFYLEGCGDFGMLNIQKNFSKTGHNYAGAYGISIGYAIILPDVHG